MAASKPRMAARAANISPREATKARPHSFIETEIVSTRATRATRSRYGRSTTQTTSCPRSRSATTAGIVWITSPNAERRMARSFTCHPERERGAWRGGRHDDAGHSVAPPGRPGPSLTLGVTSPSSAHPLQQLARGVLLRIPDDGHPPAVGAHDVALRHGVRRVVGP